MNWKRIIIFTFIIFLVSGSAAFPFGFIVGLFSAQGKQIPTWLPASQGIAVILATAVVFLFLAKKQKYRPWFHAILLALASWLSAFPINVLLFKQPFLYWFFGAAHILIALVVGTVAGNWLRARKCEHF